MTPLWIFFYIHVCHNFAPFVKIARFVAYNGLRDISLWWTDWQSNDKVRLIGFYSSTTYGTLKTANDRLPIDIPVIQKYIYTPRIEYFYDPTRLFLLDEHNHIRNRSGKQKGLFFITNKHTLHYSDKLI